jgi:hypothetical protein
MILVVSGRRQLLERILESGIRPTVLVALAKTNLDGVLLPEGCRVERIPAELFSIGSGLRLRRRLGAQSPVAFLATRPSAYGYDNVLGFSLAFAGASARVTAMAAGAFREFGWGDWLTRRFIRLLRDALSGTASLLLWPFVCLMLRSRRK